MKIKLSIQSFEYSVEAEKEYTAGELAGDSWWWADYRISTGRATYSDAEYSNGGYSVRLGRLDVTEENRLKQINRYIDPDTKVFLVPHKKD